MRDLNGNVLSCNWTCLALVWSLYSDDDTLNSVCIFDNWKSYASEMLM